MNEFFQTWRLKLGVVTLVVACVFTVGWVRSLIDGDVVWIKIRGEYFTLRSTNGDIQIHNEKRDLLVTVVPKRESRSLPKSLFQSVLNGPILQNGELKWPQKSVSNARDPGREVVLDRSASIKKAPWWQTYRVFDKQFLLGNEQYLFKDKKFLFGLQTASAIKSDPPKACFSSPYWSLVIPLTLLSAWLLLSKPQTPKPISIHVEDRPRNH